QKHPPRLGRRPWRRPPPQERRLSSATSLTRSSSGRSSPASTPDPSSVAAPSAALGAAPPPPAASSWPTTPASPPSPSSPTTGTAPSSPLTTGPPPPTPSSTPSPGLAGPSVWSSAATASSSSSGGLGNRARLAVCNPVTRQHASLPALPDFNILGMYLHGPTGEYRLLLQWRGAMDCGDDSDCDSPTGKMAAMSLRWDPSSHRGTSGCRSPNSRRLTSTDLPGCVIACIGACFIA
uniref:Uncharacterized protein n=1 Tax=Aegilops tauschii subsp. strangulata TaxID=200361 RepID=A0A453SJX5_AEGTS